MGFPRNSVVKNLPANAGDIFSIPGLGSSPEEGSGNLLLYSCPMDRRSLVGYSPWDHERVRHNLAAKENNIYIYIYAYICVYKLYIIYKLKIYFCVKDQKRNPDSLNKTSRIDFLFYFSFL